MKFIVNGAKGRMGTQIVAQLNSENCPHELLAGVDISASEGDGYFTKLADISEKSDCIIDFSHHSAVPSLLDFAVERKIPTVVATTGHTEDELKKINDAAKKIPVFFSANMSLGVALLVELAKNAASAMPEAEIEIIEKHHDRKLDAPSGTALMLANAICEVRPEAYANVGRSGHGKRAKEEIGIHAVRMGNVVGEHEVILATDNQTITIKHEAHSRALFAEGAIAAAAFLVSAEIGLHDMKSIISGVKKSAAIAR